MNNKSPKIEVLPIEQAATPDPNNTNKHTQRGRGLHENSMRKRGAGRSIFSAGKGVDIPVVMGGNQTLEIAASLNDDDKNKIEIINVHTNGRQVVNVVRDDIAPGSPEFYALAIEDNEVSKQSYNPDIDILAAVMADPAMQTLKDEDKILAGLIEGMGGNQRIKTLEELEAEYGSSEDDDFHPFIRVKVTPEIKARFDAVMVLMPGANEMEKIDALISRGELS
jgi:hypothetical protein